jgi:hypothetical protein
VSFAQRLCRLFGTIIEQKVADWGDDRRAVLLADFESTKVGNARRQTSQQVDIKGTKQYNNTR